MSVDFGLPAMFPYLPLRRFVCLEFESRRAGRFLSHITIFKGGK